MLGKIRRELFGGFVAGRDIVFYKQVETEEQERDNRDLLTMYYQTGTTEEKEDEEEEEKEEEEERFDFAQSGEEKNTTKSKINNSKVKQHRITNRRKIVLCSLVLKLKT